MHVNLNCNQPRPQFGMAFRRPNYLEMGVFTEKLTGSADEYTCEIIRKGLRQFCLEQARLKKYDVRFNAKDKSVEIINNATGKVVDKTIEMGKHTGLDMWDEKRFPGRKIFASLFNPKRFLPRELYYAGEQAKKLEALF